MTLLVDAFAIQLEFLSINMRSLKPIHVIKTNELIHKVFIKKNPNPFGACLRIESSPPMTLPIWGVICPSPLRSWVKHKCGICEAQGKNNRGEGKT